MRNIFIRILTAPFALLYGLGVSIRNFFYSSGILRGVEFDLPVISVGNLSVGGAGKTPHVEYLVRMLKDYINVATMSRGYKRKTKGYRSAGFGDTVETIGDEPLQFLKKFPDIKVTVAESRMFAIPRLVSEHPEVQALLLDDAFQHRSVKPGLNILLTPYASPFTRDFLLPSGRLREWRSAYERADVLILTKCPENLSQEERKAWKDELNPFPHQRLYFSKYVHEPPYRLFGAERVNLSKEKNVLLVCALANADYLAEYLERVSGTVRRLEFADHHLFTKFDLARIERIFKEWQLDNKIIITTEKDAARLGLHKDFLLKSGLPVFVLPAEVEFLGDDGEAFKEDVQKFLLDFKV